jgi:nicotinate-nucleotide pyrophosphorylase (carboxylating)
MNLQDVSLRKQIERFLAEDGITSEYSFYLRSLPATLVEATLHFKSSGVIAGLNYFSDVFKYLSGGELNLNLVEWEGRKIEAGTKLKLPCDLSFAVAVTGERLALNLLQRACAIATMTDKLVEKVKKNNIAILDTRKTTPGLRWLEKYAVQVGGGKNHRFHQTDVWMIKDNHKTEFGGLENAIKFFQSQNQPYKSIIVEIHHLEELKQAIKLGCNKLMLDNFSPDQIREAIKIKPQGVYFEVSGGINELNIDDFNIQGIDAISVGKITQFPMPFDISFKYHKK